jgi:hypothetical protein
MPQVESGGTSCDAHSCHQHWYMGAAPGPTTLLRLGSGCCRLYLCYHTRMESPLSLVHWSPSWLCLEGW